MNKTFHGRLGLQQRVLPNYRVPFFDMLAAACDRGLGVFAGEARPDESIIAGQLRVAKQAHAKNVHLLSGALYACYQRGLNLWLEDWNPDALIMEANPRYLATGAAIRWMHGRGRRVIGWGLGAPPLTGALRALSARRRIAFLTQFDALIAYSRRGAEEYARAGFPREKILVAPNAAAGRPLAKPSHKPSRAERPSVLFVGRLQKRKRVDALLRACAAMPEPKPRLVIVGDGPERQELQTLADGIYPDTYFAGAKHGDDLAPYFAEADLFVLPGTGGLAIQEAMAGALPVIVAKGDGTQDDLVSEANGWQIAAEDEQALQDTLQLALSDVKHLREMGKESYRIVAEEINLEKMVEVFVEAANG